MWAGRRDCSYKFGCDKKNIHKIRLNNHCWRGCSQHVDRNGAPIKEKMDLNLLERNTVDKLQAGVHPEDTSTRVPCWQEPHTGEEKCGNMKD